MFESSHVPLSKWLRAVHLMRSDEERISAQRLMRTLGVQYKTARRMARRLREAMEAGDLPRIGDLAAERPTPEVVGLAPPTAAQREAGGLPQIGDLAPERPAPRVGPAPPTAARRRDMADDDYHVALRRFLGLVDPHLPPSHRQVDPKAGLTLAEAVLHFASEDDAERHRRLALEWGDPPDTLDGVEGLTWRLRRTDLHTLECRLKSDRLAQLASGELVATVLDLGEGIHAPRTRVPADLWRILKLDFANNTVGAHGRQLADVRVFRAEVASAEMVEISRRAGV